ncbi:hypothetical protein GGR58DRAFT_524361 [Xylaria digitata]|nr:hypothetical protein GGR58DRAFT_524361 [Xylaria digitata]
MPGPGPILRISGLYHRKEEVPEEKFHAFCRDYAIKVARIHEKYGTLKYQIACTSSSYKALAQGLETPNLPSTHDLEVEYYFKDVATFTSVCADKELEVLRNTSESYIYRDTARITIAWIEVYLDDGKMVNVDDEGGSLYPSFAELSDIVETFV